MTSIDVNSDCKCLYPDYPDDLYVGLCLKSLGINMIHTNRLHQVKFIINHHQENSFKSSSWISKFQLSPSDYNTTMLQRQDPVSFHKIDVNDPIMVYNEWLGKTFEETENSIFLREDLWFFVPKLFFLPIYIDLIRLESFSCSTSFSQTSFF